MRSEIVVDEIRRIYRMAINLKLKEIKKENQIILNCWYICFISYLFYSILITEIVLLWQKISSSVVMARTIN